MKRAGMAQGRSLLTLAFIRACVTLFKEEWATLDVAIAARALSDLNVEKVRAEAALASREDNQSAASHVVALIRSRMTKRAA